MVSFEVSLTPEPGRRSLFDEEALPALDSIEEYAPSRGRAIEVARRLQEQGFRIDGIGPFTISVSGEDSHFEEQFATRLEPVALPDPELLPPDYAVRAPRRRIDVGGRAWTRGIERVYVQQPPIFMAGERPLPPFVPGKFRLKVPGDVAQLMGAAPVQRRGLTGKGVRVAMIDTGFYPHPYLLAQGYDLLAVPSPDVIDAEVDDYGHGTGESANLFATAPGVNFIGVKMRNPTLAFRTAAQLNPAVISCSWGFHVDFPGTAMPNFLKPLYAEILHAVRRGITVCFSAGNGHRSFPANIPEVIAVGGTFVDEALEYSASNYASGFMSSWFPGRRVPDVTGLVGELPTADYIVLPVPQGSLLDTLGVGWGAFSGTSAAAPMVAGVCALLKQADPSLAPAQIKQLLQYTARDITKGVGGLGAPAQPGPDLATGFGLVQADRAVDAVR